MRVIEYPSRNPAVGIGIGVAIGFDIEMSTNSGLDPESDPDTDPDENHHPRRLPFMCLGAPPAHENPTMTTAFRATSVSERM